MKNKQPSINLLKKEKDFFDKFINWALTFGRLLVILTEGVALSAFLYRFSLDRQLIDLHDIINQKQAIVKFLKPSEDKYRNMQGRIIVASKLADSGINTANFFKDIMSLAPNDLTFNNLLLSEENIKIDASVRSLSSLTTFIESLRSHPKVSSVSLDRIENKTSSGIISVSLSANIAKQENIKEVNINQLK